MPTKTASANESVPPPKRKRRQMSEVSDLLLEAASEEFKRCGFASATTAAIARRAGATEAQLFRYFGSKAELFREAIFNQLDRHFTEFNERHQAGETNSKSIRELTRLYIHELYQFLTGHTDLLLSLFVAQTYAPEQSPRVEEIDSLRIYFERGAAMAERSGARATRGVPPRMLVRMSFGAVLAGAMFKGWLFPGSMATEAEIEEAIIDFVINGIGEELDAQAKRPRRKSPRASA